MRALTLVALLLAGSASQAVAQAAPRIEVSGGGVFLGGYSLGSRTAELTSNTGTTGGTFDLFKTRSRMQPIVGVQAEVALRVTSALAIEGGVRYARPVLAIRLSADAESAADVTAEETMNQYLFGGSAVWHFGDAARRRTVPFVYGGAGYLRELHEGNGLMEDGLEYHAGAGIKWWFGAPHRAGLRLDGGVSVRDGGFDFAEARRLVPVAGASFIYTF